MYAYQRFESVGHDAQPGVGEQRGGYAAQPGEAAPDHDELQQLGAHLRDHARRISIQTAGFIDKLARFDEFKGWRIEGARSCAHWLSWRCALGRTAASEHVRVARALKRLPLIRELFGRGDLSFSKVRAITRVADDTNEDELIDLAAAHAAHDLEQRVRQYRDARSADAVKKEHQRARWQYEHRYLSYHWREDGCLQLHARLTPEQGALFLKALGVAEEAIGYQRHDCHEEASASESPSPSSANEHPAASGGSATSQAPQDDIPVRKPGQRRADALCLIANSHLVTDSDGRSSDRYQVVVNVDLDVLETDSAGTSQLDPGPAIAPETARRLSCDCSRVHLLSCEGEPLAIGRKSPVIPGSMRRALLFRDEHRCQFPGCGATHSLQGHHVHHWAQGGSTDLDNLVTLCPFHHRLLHEGGYAIEPNPEWQRPDRGAARVQSVVQAELYSDLLERENAGDGSFRKVSRGELSTPARKPANKSGRNDGGSGKATLFGRPQRAPRFLYFDRQRLRIGPEMTSRVSWDLRTDSVSPRTTPGSTPAPPPP